MYLFGWIFYFMFFFYSEVCQKKKVQVGFHMNDLIATFHCCFLTKKSHINYEGAIYGSGAQTGRVKSYRPLFSSFSKKTLEDHNKKNIKSFSKLI